ncbi:FtsX-like permease family protein [Streptomyces sp. Ncost-T10-10d]|uniref:ABC transporter permease n=1 Tax=Streptomyces sp. Ncost-T10-10d TaxID=1839774 RepID=UPI00081DF157|nr:FtsX-like permease family protein [Streptomyces sp. Ncost-T10-10d]SCF57019.1 putative ABC transport system permease protein [Streptomyces sp. Ncost-T10-10d]
MLTVALATLRTRWTTLIGTFVALALGVGLVAAMGLGLASTFDAPDRAPQRFAGSPVVVMGDDTLTVEVRRGPSTAKVSRRLAHPHPVDIALLRDLRALGQVTRDDGNGAHRGPDAVGVDAPVAEVRRVVGDRALVLTGDGRRRADPATERDAEGLVTVNALLGTAGGVTAFVSVFVVASTFAFAVALRRREFGLLRTAGATPGQLRRLLLTEAAVVGTLASAAGCALGRWAAPLSAGLLADEGMAPSWFTIRPVAWPLHAAFWTGLAVAFAGVWVASRRAGGTGPAEALREADVDAGVLPSARRLLGLALLAGAAFLMAKSLATDPSALLKRKTYTTQPMLLITAAALLAPLLVRPLVRLIRLPGATGMLVTANTSASLRRTAAVAAPVLITVALAGSLAGSAMTVTAAKAAEAREHTRADLVVTGKELKVRPVRGATLSASASTAVYVREEGTALITSEARAVDDAKALATVERLPVVAGDIRDLDDRSIVVNEEWEQHTVGSTVRVWLGDGRPVALRIAAVLARGTGNNGAYVTKANAPTAPVDRIDVRLSPGANRAAVAAQLRDTGGEVRSTEQWLVATHPRTSAQTRLGLIVILGIALVYTAIALANTMLMAGSVRSSELHALRLAGASRPRVLAVVAGETLFAVGLGTLLGLAVTAVNLAGLAAALASLSAPVAMSVQWPLTFGAAGVCAVVAVGAALLPRAVRRRSMPVHRRSGRAVRNRAGQRA